MTADEQVNDPLLERRDGSRKPLPVRAASGARIHFNIDSPDGTELVVEHLYVDQLLAYEVRPLKIGARSLDIKTHPEASHVACSLQIGGMLIDGISFSVDCGECIEPTGRNFIVIGAMKAGTTTLFELLAQHPALCRTWVHVPGVSFPKEINYFTKLRRKGDTPLHYNWRFPFDDARHAWTLDVSPNYAKWPASKGAPTAIASLGGRAKLAYILREPVDRIESHIAHMLHHGGQAKHIQHCIRTSCYALQLDKFMSHIPRGNVLLLDFEELCSDPSAIVAQVCDFLQIEHIVSHTIVHNRRSSDFRLDVKQRTEFAKAVRPDVERLISEYGFEPAKAWLR